MERKELVSGLVFRTSCNRGGDGVSLSLMRSADGFKLRGFVNSRNDWGMIQEDLERLGTWTGNQMIQLGVMQANLTSGANKEETQIRRKRGKHAVIWKEDGGALGKTRACGRRGT